MQNSPKVVTYPIESVDNALRLLHLLRNRAVEYAPNNVMGGQLGNGIGVIEASRKLRVAPSTAHRMLSMLVYHGFAVQDAAKRYRLGPSFASLPENPNTPDLRAVTRGTLAKISAESKETVHLMVLQGPSVRFLSGIEGEDPDRIDSKEGMVLPAHTTAGGRALLAHLAAAELAALYPHGLPALYAATVTDLFELSRQLTSVLRRGYAVSLDESERGIAGVAAPLRDTKGRVHGAIAVALQSSHCSGSRLHQIGSMLMLEAKELAPRLDTFV